jgi:hypothetical protein
LAGLALAAPHIASAGGAGLWGQVFDPQGAVVPSAVVRLTHSRGACPGEARADAQGRFTLNCPPGDYQAMVEAPGFVAIRQAVHLDASVAARLDFHFEKLAPHADRVSVIAATLEPAIDLRNAEVFNRTLFTRDDQVFQQLDSGIDAGQHEGGGKSLEIRRFGFNLDHGGANGGLKVMVDNVQQNQGTQGHGQGYLGSLKSLSPELISEVTIVNGPFDAAYGDFSGLGVVHIRQRESLPDQYTLRAEGGNFDTGRTFLAYSPDAAKSDAYVAYEGSYTNGPFRNPGRYRRDNVNANYTRSLGEHQRLGFRMLWGRNNFYSSGQVPLDQVDQGLLGRFDCIDASDGGRSKLGTLSAAYTDSMSNGDALRVDGFVSRSLFDLYSNFTFFLRDPVHGDAFQQHDSRLQEGANAQYTHVHKLAGREAVLTAGANFHDNQIRVGLYPRAGRTPAGVTTLANAHVTNAAGYVHESVSLWQGRLTAGTGLRYDEFRYRVRDGVVEAAGGTQSAGRWQAKAAAALRPSLSIPLTVHLNYGRGINSIDARGVVQRPDQARLATTDFYQTGLSSTLSRVSLSVDTFWIDHSNEQVYIPDDGSFEFKGPTRAYGYEAKFSAALTGHLSLSAGLTKIANAFYRGGVERVYVDSAPHLVANAALTMTAWHGWSGSLRMRAINHYRLDGAVPSIVASGRTVFDLGLARSLRRGVELNLSLDNLTNRDYYETQNYFESRLSPQAPPVARIHATPGYPLTAIAGVTFRFRGK